MNNFRFRIIYCLYKRYCDAVYLPVNATVKNRPGPKDGYEFIDGNHKERNDGVRHNRWIPSEYFLPYKLFIGRPTTFNGTKLSKDKFGIHLIKHPRMREDWGCLRREI